MGIIVFCQILKNKNHLKSPDTDCKRFQKVGLAVSFSAVPLSIYV